MRLIFSHQVDAHAKFQKCSTLDLRIRVSVENNVDFFLLIQHCSSFLKAQQRNCFLFSILIFTVRCEESNEIKDNSSLTTRKWEVGRNSRK